MKNKLIKVLMLVFSLCIALSVATACDPNEEAHEHTFSSEWTSLGDYHWKASTCGCDEKKDYAKHNLNEEGLCSKCNNVTTSRNGVYYELSDDLTYAIAVGSTETESKIVIEEQYLGISVTKIADKAFANSEVIESVKIHAGVTSIGDRAFYNCQLLNEITVAEENTAYMSGDGNLYTIDGKTLVQYAIGKEQAEVVILTEVEKIGPYAFWGCKTVSNVTFLENVTDIGNYSFSYCSSLQSVNIGRNVKTIGHDAFYACSALESIVIPDSVTNLGGCVFAWNTALKNVTIGSGVASADDGWFRFCTSLETILVSGSNKFYHSKNGSLYTKDDKVLLQYACGKQADSFVIPNDVQTISNYAFAKSNNLVSVVIPDSVTEISFNAFFGCELLKNVVIPGSVKNIGANAFASCESLKKIIIPEQLEVIGANAFDACTSLTIFCEAEEMPDSWDDDWNAFDCPVIWGHTASEGLEYSLRPDGFYEVTGVGECADADIVIPSVFEGKKVIAIADGAFASCTMLNSVTIPNSIEHIGNKAFYACNSIINIEIPDSVKTLGDSVFERCTSLEEVFIDSALQSMGSNVFYHCKALKNIEVDAKNQAYTSVDGVLFTADGTKLIQYAPAKEGFSYVVPEGVETIAQMAFADCSMLTNVVISDSVTVIEDYAFYNCNSLTTLTIGSAVESVTEKAFYDCYKLVEVYNKSTLNIGQTFFVNVLNIYTKENGSKLSYDNDFIIYSASKTEKILVGYQGTETELTIPNGITQIGAYAFYNNQSVVTVNVSKSVTSIGECAFFECNSLESIVLGANVSYIGISAFEDCDMLSEVVLNANLKTIGDRAFAVCYSLESIIIPESVEQMGMEAFSLCPELKTIYCEASEEDVSNWGSGWNSKTDAEIIYDYVAE